MPGITRGLLINIANEYNLTVEERPFSTEELINADEVLITSTTKLIKAVTYIDSKPLKRRNSELIAALQNTAIQKYEEI